MGQAEKDTTMRALTRLNHVEMGVLVTALDDGHVEVVDDGYGGPAVRVEHLVRVGGRAADEGVLVRALERSLEHVTRGAERVQVELARLDLVDERHRAMDARHGPRAAGGWRWAHADLERLVIGRAQPEHVVVHEPHNILAEAGVGPWGRGRDDEPRTADSLRVHPVLGTLHVSAPGRRLIVRLDIALLRGHPPLVDH